MRAPAWRLWTKAGRKSTPDLRMELDWFDLGEADQLPRFPTEFGTCGAGGETCLKAQRPYAKFGLRAL